MRRSLFDRVVAITVGRLSESMAADTRRLVLRPLLDPLLSFWEPRDTRERAGATSSDAIVAPTDGSASGHVGHEIASEEQIGRCLEDLEKLLTAAPPPPALLQSLSAMGLTVALFRLHCCCTA